MALKQFLLDALSYSTTSTITLAMSTVDSGKKMVWCLFIHLSVSNDVIPINSTQLLSRMTANCHWLVGQWLCTTFRDDDTQCDAISC